MLAQTQITTSVKRPPFWYQLLLKLIVPLYRLRVAQRSKQEPDYQAEVTQRFVVAEQVKNNNVVWVHAVSVGETNAAQPLITHFLQQGLPVLVTNTTRTGQARVRELFAEQYPQLFESVFLPVDTMPLVQRFLDQYQPRLLCLIETEMWPNLLAACAERGIPTSLMNARLSARSAKGYAKFARLTKPMVQQLTLIAAQDQDTANRFIGLGADARHVVVTGSVKFDLHPPQHLLDQAAELKQQWAFADRPVLIAASTHEPEELQVLQQFKQLLVSFPQAILILVPRHPQRFERVAGLIEEQGFSLVRRSQQQIVQADTQVYLADSMGELLMWFALSDIAFVGGSLSETGGHNPLEPARLGVPVIMGPHTFNFKQIVNTLCDAGAMEQVENAEGLLAVWQQWLRHPEQRLQAGQKALKVMQANEGALQRQLDLLDRLIFPLP